MARSIGRDQEQYFSFAREGPEKSGPFLNFRTLKMNPGLCFKHDFNPLPQFAGASSGAFHMSAYEDRPNTALIVIDVQNGVVDFAKNRDVVVSIIAGLVERARSTELNVIWVQHSEDDMPIDSEYWQIVPELKPAKTDRIIRKEWRSSFEETDLEQVLEELQVGHLIVSGAQSNYCVRHTIHAAIERGIDITLIEDAHTTMDESWNGTQIPAELIIAELNRACADYDLPDSFVRVVSSEKIRF